jgi:23S rRNA pseudouridine1911/1915/1917 synthase
MFAESDVHKTYWAIVCKSVDGRRKMADDGEWHTLVNWIVRNEKQNKSYAYDREVPHSKLAKLKYKLIARGERYDLVEVQLMTGRHHQIRCQLSTMGCPIKGDLKYGAPRSNPDGSISLNAHRIDFIHPVSKEKISLESPLPDDNLWETLKKMVK